MRPSVDRSSLIFRGCDPHGELQPLDICWRNNRDGRMQSWRFLESTEDNFLTQMMEEPNRTGPLLNLIISNNEGLS